MKPITEAEMSIILCLIKSPEIDYNANNLSKVIGITSMGALKILKRLEKEAILTSKKVGQATIYKINKSDYTKRYISLILSREALSAPPLIKRWVEELRKIKNAELIILFGSVLRKQDPNDIDVLLLTDQEHFSELKKEIAGLKTINIKQIHPVYQAWNDIIANIRKRDKPLLSAIKGIVVTGEEKWIEIYHELRKE